MPSMQSLYCGMAKHFFACASGNRNSCLASAAYQEGDRTVCDVLFYALVALCIQFSTWGAARGAVRGVCVCVCVACVAELCMQSPCRLQVQSATQTSYNKLAV